MTQAPTAETERPLAARNEPRTERASVEPFDPDTMLIVFGIDASYLPHAAATITSVRRTTPRAKFHFFIFHDGVAAEARSRLEAAAPGAAFSWAEIDDPAILALTGQGHISRATFYRLMLPRLVPAHAHRALYLDSDLIVARDLTSLWRTDLHGAPLGAVCDSGMDWKPFAARWNLPFERGPYFNAGVLLIDLDLVRARGSFDRAIDLLGQHTLQYMDQDALNIVHWGQWRALSAEWNVQHTMLLGEAAPDVPPAMLPPRRARPGIVHFTGKRKPWLIDGYHPYAWLYWTALRRTAFYQDVVRRHGVGPIAQARILARYATHWPFLAR